MSRDFLKLLVVGLALLAGLSAGIGKLGAQVAKSDGPPPDVLPAKFVHPVGDATAGQEVFRFETFGNQGFWTDAAQLPQGIAEARVTPIQALQLGLNVNIDAVNDATKQAVAQALQQIQGGTPPQNTVLGDPNVTLSLINQNAVIGVVAFNPDGTRKATGNTGTLNIAGGDKVGISCAVCHAITDNSILPPTPALNIRGSIGKAQDGRTAHGLDVGVIFAVAKRSLAYYPFLQMKFDSLNGATVSRGNFPGLESNASTTPTEAQADMYLTGSGSAGRFYPIGQFDDTPDGNGNPLHIAPFFRTDLAAPWGTEGGLEQVQDFNNFVYTVGLDPTSLLTPSGRQFLNDIAGVAGNEVAEDYERVLRGIGVLGPNQPIDQVFPYVQATNEPPGTMRAATGRRVDEKKLFDLNAYTNSLPAPPAPASIDRALAAQGREIFRTLASAGGGNCTSCHQVDPSMFVPPNIIPMEVIYPGYNPMLILPRPRPLSDIQNSEGPSPFFDDKLIVVDATRSGRGEVRGAALPLLLDLPRKTTLLHDDSVTGANFDAAADLLLNPSRGPLAAHPVYLASANDRRAVVEYLKSLEIRSGGPMAVVSAATFMGTEIARDSIVALYGTLLANSTQAATTAAPPTTLGGTAVTVRDSAGVTRPAGLVYVAPDQINLMIPAASATGAGVITVTSGDGVVTTTPVRIVLVAPGLFSANANGTGVAAAMIMRVRADGTQSFEPAFRFDSASRLFVAAPIDLGSADDRVFLMLFGTGIRGRGSLATVTVRIGGTDVPVLFAGAQGMNGLDQINVPIPRSLIGRGDVDVMLTVDGKAANTVRVNIR